MSRMSRMSKSVDIPRHCLSLCEDWLKFSRLKKGHLICIRCPFLLLAVKLLLPFRLFYLPLAEPDDVVNGPVGA